MPAKITNIDEDDPNKFEIELTPDATDDEKKLKKRFDDLREEINRTEKPGIADILRRLLSAERLALVGFENKPADPQAALISFGAIRSDFDRLKLPVGRFKVQVPGGDSEPSPRDIVFVLLNENRPDPIPAEQLTLKSDIESTLTTLQVIFPESDTTTPGPSVVFNRAVDSIFGFTDGLSSRMTTVEQPWKPAGGSAGQSSDISKAPTQRRFCEYQLKLKSLASVGLEGDASPDTARLALVALQNEILQREGPRIKNGYMRRLGTWALAFGGATAITYMVIRANQGFSVQLASLKNLFLLWTGTMIGTWISFGVRKPTITLRDLASLESDMVEPPLRLLFTGLIAIIFGFIFMSGMVNVKIGTLDTVQLLNRGSIALVVGMLFGVSEQALPGALTRRSSQFVSEVGGK